MCMSVPDLVEEAAVEIFSLISFIPPVPVPLQVQRL